jgi:hypothetical protein
MMGAAAGLLVLCGVRAMAQAAPTRATAPAQRAVQADRPDAQGTREELQRLLQQHAPNLRSVLALQPSLMENKEFMATYPAVADFLTAHPEVPRNPSFYVGSASGIHERNTPAERTFRIWENMLAGIAVFTGFGLAMGLIVWLIRTLVDYRRWSRLTKIQTEFHAKLLDRFSSQEELASYIKSPAGTRFLESTPIRLDAAPRSIGAPLGRIMWSLQGGLVLMAGGLGMWIVSRTAAGEAAEPIGALAILALALGAGFVISAIISFVLSRRLGLIDTAPAREEQPNA